MPLPHRTSAFTLVELLVVLGVVGLLLGLLLPVLAQARSAARATTCASNLRELGRANRFYADDNRGFVPRDHTPWRDDRPYWLLQLSRYIGGQADMISGNRLLYDLETVHCPAHSLSGEVPGTYVVNAFKFESAPLWDPDGPVKLSLLRNGSEVIWVAEAAASFGHEKSDDGQDRVYHAEFHDAFDPAHLPGHGTARISDTAHGQAANALFADGSVRRMNQRTMHLRLFDDGLRHRATPDVLK